ncbi:MAG: nucleoside 2-deoxyribosyltransferase [bacterium]|jgi:hypothetical protein|nr:nucleoside 2-deoxyribosyltransferase [candidate division KSB1 bacterium]MDH7558877.1 nucleoside 2-deoxyribosyltransferase [bacterium]
MRIYFSGSIAGGRNDLATYVAIVAHLKAQGHQVLTEHVANPGVLDLERTISPQEIFQRDMAWLRECDAVVAEVSNPSLGVGYEICQATHLGKPILCLHRAGLFISRIIVGNTCPGLQVRAYLDQRQLLAEVDKFLEMVEARGSG